MTDHNQKGWTRRNFLAAAGLTGLTFPLSGISNLDSFFSLNPEKKRPLCIFSKHLQFLDYQGMAEAAADIGFEGVDLTVRKGGHVEPENVERDLPKAVEAVKKAGLKPLMMATDINDPNDALTSVILNTAASLGIKHYRMAYLGYPENESIQATLEEYKPRFRDLAELNREYGIKGAYQNHAGDAVGAPVWDLWMLLKDLDPEWIGVQYDIRHATAEGGYSWPLGMKLLKDYISNTVIKDFTWEKDPDGLGKIKNVPLGEGMVDFEEYLKYIRDYKLFSPVTFHYEYEMPGEHGNMGLKERRKETIKVMKRDLDRFKAMEQQIGLR